MECSNMGLQVEIISNKQCTLLLIRVLKATNIYQMSGIIYRVVLNWLSNLKMFIN